MRQIFGVLVVLCVLSGGDLLAVGQCQKCNRYGARRLATSVCDPAAHSESGYAACAAGFTDNDNPSYAYTVHQISAACGDFQALVDDMWGPGAHADLTPEQVAAVQGGSHAHCLVTGTLYESHCHFAGPPCVAYDPGYEEETPGSPILIPVDGKNGEITLSTITDGVRFDLAGDGVKEMRSWPEGGQFAWLALERGVPDGKITSGEELFGDATRLRNGQRAANGFEALKEYDDNGDGMIDAFDAVFPHLKYWLDHPQRDGESQSHEITPAASHGLQWLSTDYNAVGRRDKNGNILRWMGHAGINGKTVVIYDAMLKSAP